MKCDYLITGGAGFIGSNTVRYLLTRGQNVRVLDDFSTGRRENLAGLEKDIDLVEGSIWDLEVCRKAVKGVRYVLHMAAIPSVPRSVADPLTTNNVNITGTLHMLLAARDGGVERFVLSSSSSVYGDTPVLPKRESMVPAPMSPYALSKLTNEHQCRLFFELYGLKTYCLRYFNVFGPRQNPKSQYAAVVPIFIDAMKRGVPPTVYGDGEQTRDFTFVENVIEANLACCRAPDEAVGKVFNIGCGGRMTVNDLGRAIARAMGREFVPAYAPPRPGDVRDSQADIQMAERVLGWRPLVSVDEGLRQTVEWFLTQN
jgi:nucleoside-diphosphate-sugar epimerase